MLLTRAGGLYASVSAPAFTGPGDIVSGALAFYGLRAYNAAYATGSNNAMDIVDQAGANPLTVKILSTGRLDVASISTWVTANSVSTIKVTKLYDQTGNSRDVSQATLSQMPSLNLTGFGSLPALVFSAASTQFLESSATVTQAQPITFSSVQLRGTASGVVACLGSASLWHRTVSDAMAIFAGNQVQATSIALNGSWHATQGVLNSTSSAIYSDGGSFTGQNANTNNASAVTIGIGKNVSFPISTFDGSMAEVGIWPSAFNSTQAGDMQTNQKHATNGYNF